MSRLIDDDEVVETLLCTPDVEEIFLDLAQKRRLDYLHNVEELDVVDFARDIVKAAIGVIKTSPTVDAVRVVRCKDCKRHEDEEPGMVYCPLQIGGWRHENWFCAAGERKEE